MLTIKHVTDDGHESVYPALSVDYSPHPTSVKGVLGFSGCVWYTDPETREIKSIEGGTVYVMNAEGRTVATYRMPALSIVAEINRP